MAGTINLALSQQLDEYGEPLSEGRLYFYRAGTVATPQNAYYDAALTLPLPNPYTLDAAGRIPFFFLADGSIKVVLIDRHGTTQIEADNVPVIGSSSGGGGGGTVDPTTVWQTGDLKARYATGVHTGFVRANGRTVGSATSGATERANTDTQALFLHLWNEDANLSVSTGRGASAAADWAANKTIALPDLRGRVIAGLDDMGASAAGRRTVNYTGVTATALGSVSTHGESHTLTAAQIPSITSTVSVTSTLPVPESPTGSTVTVFNSGSVYGYYWSVDPGAATTTASTGTGTSNNTSGDAHSVVDPTLFATIYIKL